jgi:putative peptidoglycan lipid II flippase
MPHGGLALANTLATGLEMFGLVIIMRRRLGGLNGHRIWSGIFKAVSAGGLMSLSIWYWLSYSISRSSFVQVAGGITLGLVVYLTLLIILKTKEMNQVFQEIRTRLG